jgi:hypothetical protein
MHQLAGETPFSEKAAWLQYRNDGSLPCGETTISLTLPAWTLNTASVLSPCEKRTCFLGIFSVVLPLPTWLK